MRTLTITHAAAASALAFAAPASAQYWPAPAPQGYGYGYQDAYGQVRSLQVRIDRIQRQIERLDRRNVLSDREARRLFQDSRELERRLFIASRNGLHPQERYQLERRLARLEQRLWRDARDGRANRFGDYQGDRRYGSYGVVGVDRDRDGRDDRFEDDRGFDHD
jgi:hypothetical protein